MPRYTVRVRVTEEFLVTVDAPSEQAAEALVEEYRANEGLDWFYCCTPTVERETVELEPTDENEPTDKTELHLVFDPELHSWLVESNDDDEETD